jgi:2-oxoglutarate dehydrogenase E1 component
MTPKSLLRHKRAVSSLPIFPARAHSIACCGTTRKLQPNEPIKASQGFKIRRVVAVLGQGLLRPLRGAREARHQRHLLLRVEQLYPFPAKALITELSALQAGRDRLVAGGAAHMGAWFFVDVFLQWC